MTNQHQRNRQRLKTHAERSAGKARKEAAKFRDGAGSGRALTARKLAASRHRGAA